MPSIFLLGGHAPSLVKFRGHIIKRLVEGGWEVSAAAPDMDNEVAAGLREYGAIPIRVGFNRVGLNPIKDFVSLIKLIIVLRSRRYDYFLGYTIKPVIFGSTAAWFAKVTNIYSLITGLGYAFVGRSLRQCLVRVIVKILYRLSLQCCDGVMFQNGDDLDEFKRLRLVNKQRVTIINGSGVDLKWYKYTGLPVVPVNFLMIARLYREKGVLEFVNAARYVKRRYPNVRFRLVGEADCNPNSFDIAEVKRWEESGLIEYFPHSRDVREHIIWSRVFVLPSYREGVPRSVLEAMAMGRPIITCNSPGCRETVIDGENGYLVQAQNEIALALVMIKMILEPERHVQMGISSRNYAELKFDVEKVTKKMLEFMVV